MRRWRARGSLRDGMYYDDQIIRSFSYFSYRIRSMQSGTAGSRQGARTPTVLLQQISDLTAAFEARSRAEVSVNATDLAAMQHLIRSGPLTPTDLAHRLSISTAAATTVVDRLTALGHASRIPNPADRRGLLVVPSEDSVRRV